jgi:hypothetical protein
MSPRRDRVTLAAHLRQRAKWFAREGLYEHAQRLLSLAEAAQWLAAPPDHRDHSGIWCALSDARFWRRQVRRQRHAVLA